MSAPSVTAPATCEGCGACCRGWGIDVWSADVGVVPLQLTTLAKWCVEEKARPYRLYCHLTGQESP